MSPFRPSFSPQPVVYSQPFGFVGPLFSYSYGLFIVPKKVKPFAIKQIRTLCAKYRGWGMSAASVPSVPARPEGGSLWQTPCSQQFAASLSSLCPLFGTRSLYFQQVAASFRKTPGVGGVRHFAPWPTSNSEKDTEAARLTIPDRRGRSEHSARRTSRIGGGGSAITNRSGESPPLDRSAGLGSEETENAGGTRPRSKRRSKESGFPLF